MLVARAQRDSQRTAHQTATASAQVVATATAQADDARPKSRTGYKLQTIRTSTRDCLSHDQNPKGAQTHLRMILARAWLDKDFHLQVVRGLVHFSLHP